LKFKRHFIGDYMTTNYTFPCGSVNGLTLNQKREALAALRISIKAERANRAADRVAAKVAKVAAANAKSDALAQKRAAAIAKAEARLQKLLDKQVGAVGAKALKANRKPGKVVTYGAEANAIAAAIMAKKQSA
jgi:hypothetical protein